MYTDAFEVSNGFITLDWMSYTTRKVEVPQEERVVYRYLYRAGGCVMNCL